MSEHVVRFESFSNTALDMALLLSTFSILRLDLYMDLYRSRYTHKNGKVERNNGIFNSAARWPIAELDMISFAIFMTISGRFGVCTKMTRRSISASFVHRHYFTIERSPYPLYISTMLRSSYLKRKLYVILWYPSVCAPYAG